MRTQYVAHSSLTTVPDGADDRITLLENIPASDKAENVSTFHPEAMWATLEDIDGMENSIPCVHVTPSSLPVMKAVPVTSVVPPRPITVYAL